MNERARPARADGRSSLAAALGVPVGTVRLYRQLRAGDGTAFDEVAASLLRTPAQLREEAAELFEAGVVEVRDGVLHVATAPEAVSTQLARQAREVTEAAARLERTSEAVPLLAELWGGAPPTSGRFDAEVVAGEALPVMVSAIAETAGELCFLRPDQWRLPTYAPINAAVDDALRHGRRVRAIYPARVWREQADLLRARREAGEEVRLLASVPTRLGIFGEARAVFPDPPGAGNDQRVVVRHQGMVQLLTGYFEELWERAVEPPTTAAGGDEAEVRLLILDELARGARDEQIARTLGLSLRTVRRRVAELLIDLGADSRFQAGVEAARRGWV